MQAVLAAVTFFRDVVPILQNHCQECHRPGQMAPMPLRTYEETRPWAKAIRDQVRSRKMPPWPAQGGHFSNDRSLNAAEIETLAKWADTGAEKGDLRDAPREKAWPQGWNLASHDLELAMPRAFELPAAGTVDYQYFPIPTGFKEDRWVQAVEVRPGNRAVVHHIVVYIRKPGSTWTGGPTKADILTVYAPGSTPDSWPEGTAKLIKAGSDLVFEIHYTPNGKPASDRTTIALAFAKKPPGKRVLTLQLNNDHFLIPAGERDYRVTAWGSIPNDGLLLSFFPHMHLRGKSFLFALNDGKSGLEELLNVPNYDFFWQLSYRLQTPIPVKKGMRLQCWGTFDNSANNPRNPDPDADVRYGQQSWEEMMIGFFDVAVDAKIGKPEFFTR
ncbi:MAG: thiol-disulfide isomerase [Bryobacteraceae bacterium]